MPNPDGTIGTRIVHRFGLAAWWPNMVGQVIAGLLVILIVAMGVMKWPWIKEFLG